MSYRTILCAFLLALSSLTVFAQTTVTDADIQEGQTFTMTSGVEYLLDGFVFVEDGATLVIEAGAVIKGKAAPTTGDLTSALIISQGGKIYARGTQHNPIIFTAEADDVNDPFDLTFDDRGEWGGVILLGRAQTNLDLPGQVEGLPTDEGRGTYGGDNDSDNSGILRYVSIRHAGAEISPGNEINGLTLAGVGNGTEISHVEVFANVDDGVEWFGGTVNTQYLAVSFCGDDSFDYDQGWRGANQFWFSIKSPTVGGGRVGEHDGGDEPEDGTPFATPYIANATFIGGGATNFPQGDGSEAIIFRDNAGGKYLNSIITEYNGANGGKGITIEDLDSGEDSRARLEAGDLLISNNIWWQFGAGNDLNAISDQDFVQAHLADNNNTIVDPQINNISHTNDGTLDPRPAATSPAANGAVAIENAFFAPVKYQGAFDPYKPLWTDGWTALSAEGHTADLMVDFTDADINAGETVTLEAGKTYLMDGFVFVEDGATLIIEPGTVIKGKAVPSSNDLSSALIVSQGGKIMANGTAEYPIIFTAESDDLSDPFDLTFDDRGEWGGVIVLGHAQTNLDLPGQVEGLPTDEGRGTYGGDNDDDNSGVLRYISIRHAGAEISPGNEINGLTLGGVGRGTTVEYIEVFANVDDGVEWFGGTVNTRYLAVAFCGDDSFDYDQGWRGNNQYWFSIQSPTVGGGRIGEHDGGDEPEDGTPFAEPHILNATYIGGGSQNFPQGDGSEAITFRDNAAGFYVNSIITEYNGANGGNGIRIEDLDSGEDSRARLEEGTLVVANNLWYDFGAGNTIDAIAPQDFVQAHLLANGNQIVDPGLNSVSRSNDGRLDPRPARGSAGAKGAISPSGGGGFFDAVPYYGAFDPSKPLWTNGWTALSAEGHTADRWVGHVTRAGGGFETEIRFNNRGMSQAVLTLNPYAIDGTALPAVSAIIGGRDVQSYPASALFGSDEVSHFSVSGSNYVEVSASYKSTGSNAASADVAAQGSLSQGYSIFAGEWDVVFDGLAVVNLGNDAATITAIQKDGAGNEIGRVVVSPALGPLSKDLVVFETAGLTAAPGSTIEIHSTQPTSAVFLRGTTPGAAINVLYVTVPTVLD